MYNNAYPPADMGNYMQNHAYPTYDYPPPTGPGFNAYAGQLPNVMQPNPPGLCLWIHLGGVKINWLVAAFSGDEFQQGQWNVPPMMNQPPPSVDAHQMQHQIPPPIVESEEEKQKREGKSLDGNSPRLSLFIKIKCSILIIVITTTITTWHLSQTHTHMPS